jgi:predicted N-acyltransferase
MKFEEITKDFFKNISKNMPDETRFFLWRLNGKLVGFTLCLISKDLLVAEYLGFDYDVALDYHLYFLAYRDKIDWCIRNGIRRYESGALNYDPKKRLDFKFVPQYVYAKHTNRIANFFLGPLCALLKPENFDPILKSSKEKALSF